MAKKIKYVTLAEAQKGDTVYMYLFSGAQVGRDSNAYEVAKADSKTLTIETGRGTRVFSRKTGVQVNADNPRYANFILGEPDDKAKEAGRAAVKLAAEKAEPAKPAAPAKADKKKAEKLAKPAKPAKGKKAAEPVDEDEFEDADDLDDED